MEVSITSEFFKGNRTRLRKLFPGTAPIVLSANGLIQRNADTNLAFRQDSSFWYFVGLNKPDLILVIDKDREYLILPVRDEHQNIFDGTVNAELLSQQTGIKQVLDNKAGWKQLSSRLKRVKHVATKAVAPAYVGRYGFYTNPAHAALINRIKEVAPKLELLDISPHIVKMRTCKQPEELAAIQNAIDITSNSLKKIQKKLPNYKYEYEIEAELSLGFRTQGAFGHSYTPIVAAGINACTLHYVQNNSPINPKDLLLIDAGAEVQNYAADISRTFAISKPTRRQKAIYDAVLEVQEYAFSRLKPGVSIKTYEQDIENFMGEKLRELGLIKTITHENVRKYYPHGTSHFLGLDVHDVGNYEQPLEPNVVITVEPGIYIPKEKIGIRIEDDVRITTDGIEVLSDKLPKSL